MVIPIFVIDWFDAASDFILHAFNSCTHSLNFFNFLLKLVQAVHNFLFYSYGKFLGSVVHILAIFNYFIKIIPDSSETIFNIFNCFCVSLQNLHLGINSINIVKLSIFDLHVFTIRVFNKPLLLGFKVLKHACLSFYSAH